MKRRYIPLIMVALIGFNLGYFWFFDQYAPIDVPTDADRLPNGNTLICDVLWEHFQVLEVDPAGNVVWGFYDVAFPHDADKLPNGNILIADTENSRVIEVNYSTHEIVWEWNATMPNWTAINPKWGAEHYYNNPTEYDWTHLNDVEYLTETNTILISLRNFDLIIEVNKTKKKEIVWYYGDWGNQSKLFHQHNPDKMPNGNIIVSDSENNRILIINYTTKQIVWVYDKGLSWPRDCDYLNETNTVLITDSLNNRIIEVTMEKEIVWSYHGQLIVPYEADLLDNGNILIGNCIGDNVIEIDRNGKVVWSFGTPYIPILFFINLIFFACLIFRSIILNYRKRNQFWNRKTVRLLFMLGLCVWIGVLYTSFITYFLDVVWFGNFGGVLEKIFY